MKRRIADSDNQTVTKKAKRSPQQASSIYLKEKSTKPQVNDFYHEINAEWLAKTTIPKGYSMWSSFEESDRNIKMRLRTNLERKKSESIEEDLVKTFYKSFNNTKKIKNVMYDFFDSFRIRLAEIHTLNQLMIFLAELAVRNITPFFSVHVLPDSKNSSINRLTLSYGNLLVPNIEYYEDEKYLDRITALKKNIKDLSSNLGLSFEPEALVQLDGELADIQPTSAEKRDERKFYFYVTKQSFIDDIDNDSGCWNSFFNTLKSKSATNKSFYVDDFVCYNLNYFRRLTKLLHETDIVILKDYVFKHILDFYAPYCCGRLADIQFTYHGTALSGKTDTKMRWLQALDQIDRLLGHAIGKVYIQECFSETIKIQTEEMVTNIMEEMRLGINDALWLSHETKQKALEKLSQFRYRIGYPNVWRDYSGLTFRDTNNIFWMVDDITLFDSQFNMSKINMPVDKEEWTESPHIVNAFYDSSKNEIIFPAGILQKPFFDPTQPMVYNYGAIGSVIAHEITHGYDDEGSKFDGNGNMIDWWTSADRIKFEALSDKLKKQFDSFCIHEKNVNGQLTLGENLADLGGITLAFRAAKKIARSEEELRNFFIGFATVWRSKVTKEEALDLLATDCHAPDCYRGNTVRNLDEFYELYDVGIAISLKPSERIKIW